MLARNVSERLGAKLGQPIVIENRGGAGGNVGAEYAAKQPARRLHADARDVVASRQPEPLRARSRYDPVKDFAPVALLIRTCASLRDRAASDGRRRRTVHELIALAKAKPGQAELTAPAGNGSTGASGRRELFKTVAGHRPSSTCPYKAARPRSSRRCSSGRTQLAFPTFDSTVACGDQVKAGKLRALGVTSPQAQSAALPDVPTLLEAMPNGFDLEAWFGIWAPAGTPPDVVRKLNADVGAVLADPEFRGKLASDGSEVVTGGTPDEFAGYVKSETAKWAKVVKDSGARIE